MRILIFFQCCQQQLIYAHTLRLGISFDLVTLTLRNVYTDIIVLLFEILRVRRCFLPLGSTVLAILLRTRGHNVCLSAERTDLLTADLHSRTRFFLFFVSPISLDLHLITAVFAVFRTVGVGLKFHSAHLTFSYNHSRTPLSSHLLYQILGAKSSITANLCKSYRGKQKNQVPIAAHRQKSFPSQNYT